MTSFDDGLVYGPRDANQEALVEFDRVVAESSAVKESGADYLASRHDVDNRATWLYFRHPDRIPAVVAREAERRAISYTLVEWPYSLAEIRAAASRVTDAFSSEPGRIALPDGFRVHAVQLWDGKFAGLRLGGSYRDGRDDVPPASVVAAVQAVAGVPVQIRYEEAWVDDSPAQRAIPDGVETITVSPGIGFRPEHRLIRRDARQLLWAMGKVEQDLQGTLGWQWTLAMRSSLSIIAEHDGRGADVMSTISPGLDPADVAIEMLDAQRIQTTLILDSLDSVGRAAQGLLESRSVRWPTCAEHPAAAVNADEGRWLCSNDDHLIAKIGQLAPKRRKRLRPDGTSEFVDKDE